MTEQGFCAGVRDRIMQATSRRAVSLEPEHRRVAEAVAHLSPSAEGTAAKRVDWCTAAAVG